MFHISQGWCLGEIDIYISSYMCIKFSSCLQQCKNYKIDQDFPKLLSQMYCHVFVVYIVRYVHTNVSQHSCWEQYLECYVKFNLQYTKRQSLLPD